MRLIGSSLIVSFVAGVVFLKESVITPFFVFFQPVIYKIHKKETSTPCIVSILIIKSRNLLLMVWYAMYTGFLSLY